MLKKLAIMGSVGPLHVRALLRTACLIAVVSLVVSLLVSMPVSAGGTRYGDVTGPVTADSLGLRLPLSKAEFQRMTTDDHARVAAAIAVRTASWNQLVEAGLVRLQSVSALPNQSRSTSGFRLARPLAVTASGQCRLEWQDLPGGTNIRAYAITQSDTWVDNVSAHARLLRDGTDMTGWYGAFSQPGSRAEVPTNWIWKWSFESYNWTAETAHNVSNGSTYYLGPNAPCSVSRTF